MVPDPDLVLYACIAKGETVLAEFNSRDESLGPIALKCLEKTPPFHSTFAHTVRARTYTFLIDDPFSYFTIFDEHMGNYERLEFLRKVKEAFEVVYNGDLGKKKLERLTSHCFQGELNPVFHQLVGPEPEMDSPGSPVEWGDVKKSSKKKKQSLSGELKIVGRGGVMGRRDPEQKLNKDDDDEDGIGSSCKYSISMPKDELCSGEVTRHHRAKEVWKRQVWVVLWLDLFVCSVMFIVWLWVCRGFKCVNS